MSFTYRVQHLLLEDIIHVWLIVALYAVEQFAYYVVLRRFSQDRQSFFDQTIHGGFQFHSLEMTSSISVVHFIIGQRSCLSLGSSLSVAIYSSDHISLSSFNTASLGVLCKLSLKSVLAIFSNWCWERVAASGFFIGRGILKRNRVVWFISILYPELKRCIMVSIRPTSDTYRSKE